MNKNLIKQILIVLGTVALFLVLSYGFMPEVLSGKIVNQADISSWHGMTREVVTHNKANPEDPTLWTNSMFGGMPTAAMYDDFDGDWTQTIYKTLLAGKRPATYLFIALLGGFLMMLSLGVNWILAIAGGIAVAFCSYNFQIIQVGHNTKMQAIAFMPWVIAGMLFTYRSALAKIKDKKLADWLPKTILGAVLFALALSMQIKANHPQITYYLAIIIFIYAISLFIWLCMSKERKADIKGFIIASSLLLVVGLVGIATNLNKLIPTYEYAQYTMRGGSELSPRGGSGNSKGLDLEYATAWSYGIEEMPNLMIPNFNGGASAGELGKDSETYDLLRRAGQPNLNQIMKSLPLYWGPQPFTAGPMYLGAICIFLFVLGIALLKGVEKWWLIIASVIASMLAWGNHFMWFTELWFDHAPMYNKFRTVSMALTVLQVTVPLLGFYALDRAFRGGFDGAKVKKAVMVSYAITAGFCLLCVIFPAIAGDFAAASDASQPDILADALAADRRGLLVSDAFRSFALITCAAALILWYGWKKDEASSSKLHIACGAIALIVLFDLFAVGKRYLNSDHFVSPKEFKGQFAQRPVDKIILEDKDLDYRVLDVSVNTFNDSHQSYHHKCIGGYSPAKMQRYQDLIEQYISGEISEVFEVVNQAETVSDVQNNLPFLPINSMLNAKYIIIGEDYAPIVNPYRFGNAWFVDSVIEAKNPDEEIALLAGVNSHNAVIGEDFAKVRSEIGKVEGAEIALKHYAANYLRYSFSTPEKAAALFSEIYYPAGWKAWIEPKDSDMGSVVNGRYCPSDNAQELDLFRANWILRGAVLPAGEGEVVMRFEPESYTLGANLSRASSITLILLMLASAIAAFRKKRQ
jgi:hypothetical protein